MPTVLLLYYQVSTAYSPKVFNMSWVLRLPVSAQITIIEVYWLWGVPTYLYNAVTSFTFGVTSPGVQSPLAEAIANLSVVPEYAAFLGLNSSYSENYYASLAKAALSSSSISLSVSPTSTAAGTPVTLTAALTYANGTPASGIGVTFASDGKAIGTSTTSSSGVATLSYTPTSAGTYSLTADLTSHTSTASSPVTLTVTSPPVTPTPTPTTNYSLYYAVAIGVVVVVAVVAAVLALGRKGKKEQNK